MRKVYNLFEAITLNMLASFSAFIVTVFLGKTLPVSEFGDFSTALFIILLVSPLVGFGLPKFLLREFGREGLNAEVWLEPSFIFVRNSLIFIVFVVSFISIFLINSYNIAYYTLLLLPVLFNQVLIEFFSLKFQLERNFKKVALVNAVPNILRFVFLLIIILFFEMNIYIVICIYSLVSLLLFLFGLKEVLNMRNGKINYHFEYLGINNCREKKKLKSKEIVKQSWPFGVMGVAYLVFFQINIFLVNVISGSEASGLYAAAFVFINAIYIFPSILYQKILLPRIHYLASHNYRKIKEVYRIGNLFMLFTGIVLSGVIFIASEWLIVLFYGERYIDAAYILKYLALAIPFRFLSNSLGAILVTRNSMLIKVKIMTFLSILNLILGWIFISVYHIDGAIFVLILCEFLLMFLYYIQTKIYFIQGDKSL